MTNPTIRHLLAGAVALSLASVSAHAQDVDARWRAWIGCWTPTTASMATRATICVRPVEANTVELMSVFGSSVVNRVRITADGEPHAVTRDGCTGTETARWSESGTRLYTSESMTCPGGMTRSGSGVMSFTQAYEWLDIRGMSTRDAKGVAVARYEALVDTAGLPADVLPVFALRGPATNNAILAASAPLTLADIADVGTTADSGVAGTWLVERTRNVKVSIDGKQLTRLADYGVPSSVIDVLVAVSHPAVFALEGNSTDATFRERPATGGNARTLGSVYGRSIYGGAYYGSMFSGACYPSTFLFDPWYSYGCYSPYYGSRLSSYGSSYYSPYYSPFYGYYPGAQPIVVINRPVDDRGGLDRGESHGRVVKGRGYTSGSSSGSSGGSTSRPASGSSSGSSSSGESSGSSSAGSSGGSSGSTRTAVRRPPG